MAFFAPFAFREQRVVTPPAPAWDPSDFTDIQYWWRADSGVTTATGGVSSWLDQINSFDLQQSNSSNRPSSTTNSNLNNQDVISFNGSSDYLWTTSTPASLSNSDFTALAVYSFSSTSPGNGIVYGTPYILSAQDGRWWLDGLNGNQRLVSEGLGNAGLITTNVESPITTGAHSFKARYDASAGDMFYALDTLTESTQGTTGNTNQDWPTNSTIAAGAAVSSTAGAIFLSRYIEVDIAEIVYVYGTPTTTEMNNWKTYVNNRYGTIIS